MPMTRIEERTQTYHECEVDGVRYERYAAGSWYQWMGESLEPVYSREEELEAMFQESIKK